MASQTGRTAGAFDIRLIIAVLFFVYGVVLTIMGSVATSATTLAKSAGFNINLWSGVGMLIFAVLFALWVRLRPIIVPAESAGSEESGQ
jgi:hypothetical protein